MASNKSSVDLMAPTPAWEGPNEANEAEAGVVVLEEEGVTATTPEADPEADADQANQADQADADADALLGVDMWRPSNIIINLQENGENEWRMASGREKIKSP